MNRDFDFWIGEWTVTNQESGELAGWNVIEAVFGGRVLVERYSTPQGFEGTSLNAYDESGGRWHQCWMDSSGGVLDLYGGLVDGVMLMKGETRGEGGRGQLEQITWTPNPDGSVRQHWVQSTDDGGTWTTVFDGLYRRQTTSDGGSG
jgi:hypothetical protein